MNGSMGDFIESRPSRPLAAGPPLAAWLIGFAIAVPAAPVAAQDGEAIFQNTCKPCHTIGGGRLVGPDLAGLSSRRPEAWVIEFVQHSQAMVARGDSTAVALAESYPGLVMPDWPLSEDEVRAILDYIEREETAGAGASTAAALPEGDPAAGAGLFEGTRRLENGGPACNACHHVDAAGVRAGGSLAKDLTGVVGRLGDAGVAAVVATPPFPAMQTAFRDRPLTGEEVADLTAFLRERADGSEATRGTGGGAGALLLGLGLGGALVLLASFGLIWRGRRRGTVYRGVFGRQIRSTT